MARCMLVAAALLGFASQYVAAQSSSADASVAAPQIPSWAAADPSGYASFGKALNQQFVSLRTDFGSQINSGDTVSSGILGLGLEAAQLVADLPSIPLGTLKTAQDKQLCRPAVLVESFDLPTQCVGSVYEYIISGGYCVISGTKGPVTCKKPSIELVTKGSFCNLATKTPVQIKDIECNSVNTFDGLTNSGTISGGDETTLELSEVLSKSGSNPASGGASASAASSSSSDKKHDDGKSDDEHSDAKKSDDEEHN